MSNESYPRSIQATDPVDPSVVRVLRVLDPIAGEVDCAYFVAGATARDLILVNLHGLRPGRATLDIDFGIAVESWEQFAILKARLVGTGEFVARLKSAAANDLHRSDYRILHSSRSHSVRRESPPLEPSHGPRTGTLS
jgi:hypothetical protein